ncbi:hypothetical protein MYX76_07645 [Desulfobacterota bacterium AH_259_B03_O07]|nr:hypothetical protein [Desulfobacterota bacterium AH_259_B03_O07]
MIKIDDEKLIQERVVSVTFSVIKEERLSEKKDQPKKEETKDQVAKEHKK